MKHGVQRAVSALATALLCLTAGCNGFFVYPGTTAGGGTGTGTGDYVYVANQTAGTLVGYSIGTNALTALSGSPYNLGFTPVAVAVNAANTIVFVSGSNGVDGLINAYAIGASGGLTLLASNNLGSADEVALDISPDGQWLLGLDSTGTPLNEAIIDEYSINTSNGQLTLIPGNGIAYRQIANQGTIAPSAIKFAPNGQLVFLALGTAGDLVYTFNTSSSSGALTQSQTFPLSAGSLTADNALAVSPNGSAVFFARSSGTTGSVAAYTVTGTTVAAVGGTSVAAGDQPFSVVVNTAGTDVYVANQLGSNISGYSGAGNGALTALNLSPYTTGSEPTELAVDHSGAYLLGISFNASGNNLSMYSFDASGNLALATSTNTGSGPTAMAATH